MYIDKLLVKILNGVILEKLNDFGIIPEEVCETSKLYDCDYLWDDNVLNVFIDLVSESVSFNYHGGTLTMHDNALLISEDTFIQDLKDSLNTFMQKVMEKKNA